MDSFDNPPGGAEARAARLAAENAELKIQRQELQDTLDSIHTGDVDALVVNGAIYTLESAQLASNQLRQDVLGQMEEVVFAFDNAGNIIYVNAAAERRYGVTSADVLGHHRSRVFVELPAAHAAEGVSAHQLADGSVVHVESTLSTLSDAVGHPVGTLAVIRDVTQRLRGELRREALATLGDRLRDLINSSDIEFAAVETIGQTLNASRVGYGNFDPETDTLHVDSDWTTRGAATLVGDVHLRDYGSFVDSLKRNELVIIGDVRTDARTALAVDALTEKSTLAFVNVPIVEQGRLVAVLFVNDDGPRAWAHDDVRFIREVAERTRSATERAREIGRAHV